MLIIPPPKFRSRRGRVTSAPAAGTAPNLLSGAYGPVTGLTLVFDQAVAVRGFTGAAIVVSDPGVGTLQGTGTPAVSGTSVTIAMVLEESAGGRVGATHPVLNAAAGSGVMAVVGGLAWAGVTEFTLATQP